MPRKERILVLLERMAYLGENGFESLMDSWLRASAFLQFSSEFLFRKSRHSSKDAYCWEATFCRLLSIAIFNFKFLAILVKFSLVTVY